MHFRVYDNRDNSCNSTPSPSLRSSITHAHRSIGHHNHPQSLAKSTRLRYLSMFDSRVASTPSPLPDLPPLHLVHERLKSPQDLALCLPTHEFKILCSRYRHQTTGPPTIVRDTYFTTTTTLTTHMYQIYNDHNVRHDSRPSELLVTTSTRSPLCHRRQPLVL